MRVLKRSGAETVWEVEGGGEITYRLAESLDRDIAVTIAAKYAKEVVQGVRELEEFGLTPRSNTQIIAELGENIEEFAGYSKHFYAIAIGERCISKISGLADEHKAELRVCVADLGLIFADDRYQSEWMNRVFSDLHEVDREGNASGSTLNTNTDEGEPIAETAEEPTKPVPAAESGPTDLDVPDNLSAQKPNKVSSSSPKSLARVSGKPDPAA